MKPALDLADSTVVPKHHLALDQGGWMISLTRLNNQVFALNPDHMKFIEQAPDTVITLTTGEKIVVRQSSEEIIERIVQFRRRILHVFFSNHIPHNFASIDGERRG